MNLAIDTAQSFDEPNNGGGNASLLQSDIVQPGSNMQVMTQTDQIVAIAGSSYVYSGQVVDSTNEQPIPFASVILFDAMGNQINGQSADINGNFNLAANQEAVNTQISASDYIPFTFPSSEYQHLFELERTADLPGVTLTTKKSSNSLLLLLLIVPFIIKEQKSKSVGKLNRNEVVTYIIIAAAILGLTFINKNIFDTVHNLLVSLGIAKGQGEQQTNQEQTNPYSPWKPGFYQSAPAGALLLYNDQADQYAQDIFDAFGVLSDDFENVMGVFSQLQTQSQVSYLADRFSKKTFTSWIGSSVTGLDLLTFLTNGGGVLPWDGLSDSHLKILTDYVNNLPKYTA